MNPRSLEDRLRFLAETTDGVSKLKDIVVGEAVHGSLTERVAPKTPLREIKATVLEARQNAYTEGRIRRPRTFPKAKSDEVPFQIPSSWEWIRVGEAANLINGNGFKKSEWSSHGLPIIRIQNLNDEAAPFNYCDFEVPNKYHVHDGDLLISWSGTPGTSFGAFVWNRGHAVLNQHIFNAVPFGAAFRIPFLKLAINARMYELVGTARGGVGLKHFTKGQLESLLIPLPPLEEQDLILNRTSELLHLCNELDQQKQNRDLTRSRLTKASYHRLAIASAPADVSKSWQRIANSFDVFSSAPEDLQQLRLTIRSLAITGRLSSPVGTIDDLVEVVRRDRTNALADGTTKRSHRTTASHGDADLELPSHWRVVPLADLLVFGPKNGYSPRTVEKKTAVKTLSLSATTRGVFNPAHVKYVDEEIAEDSHLWLVDEDILIQRGNSIEFVGVAAIFRGNSHEFIYPDLMMKIRVSGAMNVEYVHLVLNSPLGRKHMSDNASGTSGSMPKINQGVVLDCPLPLPPRPEQDRIVSTTKALFQRIDDLENRMDAATALASQLTAVLSNAWR